MEQNRTNWTAAKEQAARDMAEGLLTQNEIAARATVSRTQFHAWKKEAKFKERVKEIVAELSEVSRLRSIGRREDRIGAYQQRWGMINKSILAREEELSKVDLAALLKASLDVEKQAAIEAGQWTEKQEITGKGGKSLRIRFVEVVKPNANPAPSV